MAVCATKITFLKADSCFSVTLPEKPTGRYWACDEDESGHFRKLVCFEGEDGGWAVLSSKKAWVVDTAGNNIDKFSLDGVDVFGIRIRQNAGSSSKCIALVEPLSNDRRSFTKLLVSNNVELRIGRDQSCDIRVDNTLVSSKHAILGFNEGTWTLEDCASTNGTYLNGQALGSGKRVVLKPGDYVYVVGMCFIVGERFIALNNPDNTVSWSNKLARMVVEQNESEDYYEDEDEKDDSSRYFYRSPRFMQTIEAPEIVVDAPPALQPEDDMPVLLSIGPALTMGLAAVFSGTVMAYNTINNGGTILQAAPMLVMACSMILGMALWPTLSRKFQARKHAAKERQRQARYRDYLDQIRDQILQEEKKQTEILRKNVITPEHCINRALTRSRRLWDRTAKHPDFLTVRLGVGEKELEAKVKFPEQHFSVEVDCLQDELQLLACEPRNLKNVPISLSLSEEWLCGIIGDRKLVVPFVRGLVAQLVCMHSYDELKLVFLIDKEELPEWNGFRWLPHVWSNEEDIRYFATNIDEARELSLILEKLNAERVENKCEFEKKDCEPYFVVVAASRTIAEKTEFFRSLIASDCNRGFSVLALFDTLDYIPKECTSVIQLGGKGREGLDSPLTTRLEVGGGNQQAPSSAGQFDLQNVGYLYDKDDTTGSFTCFTVDVGVSCENIDTMARALSNVKLDLVSQRYTLPKTISFLDMLEVGKVEHLNIASRWSESVPSKTLQAPIGVDENGDIFMLDLHEKFHGPHGLVAGMTGSGKSEFIITYILSLAINYRPEEVSFVLIDYKGGGLAGAFDNEAFRLPHLAGTITNLDGAAISRSLTSIQSELRRRQAVFNEARDKTNSGTMDIYRYQQLYRQGAVEQPVSHLFIISDEFAELKAQQPEFMDQLISTARIGRSLGVHLILATQKPSGVVNDQIWSNSKFKVCMKVQDRSDSMDMIRRPDAAALVDTGRFYLQVGFNELFSLGQSAWCGAPYVASNQVKKKEDDSLVVVSNTGRAIAEEQRPSAAASSATEKQIVAILRHVNEVAQEKHAFARQLWLPALPDHVYVDVLEKKYQQQIAEIREHKQDTLFAVVGEIDDPDNQKQLPLCVSLGGGVIVYGAAGSGKFTFVATLLYALIKSYTPEELNIYIADFGAETLAAFRHAPHVGDVVLSGEAEKVTNLFKMLGKELVSRREKFSKFGGDRALYSQATGETVPEIVVVINGMAAFYELFEKCEQSLINLSREASKYGIYFLLTATSNGSVRFKLSQNFRHTYALKLNDSSEYGAILGGMTKVIPAALEGRGLVRQGKRILEFQTAYPDSATIDVFQYIKEYCDKLPASSIRAKRVPILPKKINAGFFEGELGDLSAFPVGVVKDTLSVAKLDLTKQMVSFVLSTDFDRLVSFADGFVRALCAGGHKVVLLDADGAVGSLEGAQCIQNTSECAQALKTLAKGSLEGSQLVYVVLHPVALLSELDAAEQREVKASFEKAPENQQSCVVFIETAANLNPVRYETWVQRYLGSATGVWVSDGIAEQAILKITKVTMDMYSEVPSEFGYLVLKGKAQLAKFYAKEGAAL